jgi:PiT family inorganic phosphate transporter
LLFSPFVGFVGALVLLFVMKRVLPDRKLYEEPEGQQPPPKGIRALLIFTCTAVSFAHGGNDGQKGMGLIMLILIGVAPTAYALNRTVSTADTPAFVQSANRAAQGFAAIGGTAPGSVDAARKTLTDALKAKQPNSPAVYGAAAALSTDIGNRVRQYGSISQVPAAATPNLRNDMYLVLDTATLITKDKDKAKSLPQPAVKAIGDYQKKLEQGTRYIPTWVKVAVAIALGLGTMVGWKRIVVTVGEKIGKIHLTYGMGASAELTAASTILLAEFYGMPVSTTHILSSGVAGASVANGAGLQKRTVFAILSAWVLTLPAAMLLAGVLYWVLLMGVRAFGLH